MKSVEEVLIKYNWPARTSKPTTAISEIENIIKFKLPDDYLIFAQNFLGSETFIGQEFVRLWDFDELLTTNKDYQIFENLPRTLGIGGNGSSEFIAIEQTESSKIRVVISPFIDLDKSYHIEIGDSFADFLNRLDHL